MTLFTKFYLLFTSISFFNTPHPNRVATVSIPEDEIVIIHITEDMNY